MICEHRREWGELVTPRRLRSRPIYNWFVYPHSYDKSLVEQLLHELSLPEHARIWDPFVGAGTTVKACRDMGMHAVGTDLLPLSIQVTRAKVADYDGAELRDYATALRCSHDISPTMPFSDIPIVKAAIPERLQIELSAILTDIAELPCRVHPFFLTALARVVAENSRAIKSGGWLRIDPHRDLSHCNIKESFLSRITGMISDVESDASTIDRPPTYIELADARTAKLDQRVDAIICSPPYLNRHDYTRVFALELAIIGALGNSDLKALRYSTFRSHVEAKMPSRRPEGYCRPALLEACLHEIEARGMRDNRVPRMIEGYFEDMYAFLHNAHQNLSPGGSVALVLGDVRFAGVMIPVCDLCLEIGAMASLEPERAIVTRFRGNSAQQMGQFGRIGSQESVLTFRNLA